MTVLALGSLAACSLGGKQPRYDFFVLSPATAARPGPSSEQAATLGVRMVTIPGYLDREAVAMRLDDHRLVYSEHDRWAEPLDQAFERTLRQELGAHLAPAGIAVPANIAAPTCDVAVDVVRFERRGRDRVELWARWSLRTDAGVVDAGETRIRRGVQGGGSEAAAAALSQTIAGLASEIAGEVRRSCAAPGLPAAT